MNKNVMTIARWIIEIALIVGNVYYNGWVLGLSMFFVIFFLEMIIATLNKHDLIK